MRSDRIDGPESRGGVLGCWRGAGGTYGRTGRGRRGVDLAIREQHEVRSELQAFCRTPYTDHSDSQIPRTARCRTTARSSHLGNGYGISCRYAMVDAIAYRDCICGNAAAAPTLRRRRDDSPDTRVRPRAARFSGEDSRSAVYAATPRRARTMAHGAWRERTSHENAEDRRADQG